MIKKKRYFIVGGTSSVGQALIQKLCYNQPSSEIFFTYNKDKKKSNHILSRYKNTKAIKLNLESKKDITNLKNFKYNLDAIILCAANTKFIPIKSFMKFTPDQFAQITNINLISQYSIIYYLYKKLNKNSNLIFLSSIASKNAIGSNCAYSASKAAINNLTIFFSNAFQGKIIVNAVAPGLMHTKLTKNFSKKYFLEYAKKTNSKKLTNPNQVAELIYFIIDGSKNINGQTLFVDGGSN